MRQKLLNCAGVGAILITASATICCRSTPKATGTNETKAANHNASTAGAGNSPVWPGRRLIYPEVRKKAQELAGSPAHALPFVSSELRFEAYRGALRGPRGVLLAGGGNATDKALLLKDLFRVNNPGTKTRFAFCTLSDSDTDQLLARAVGDAGSAVQPRPVQSGPPPTAPVNKAAQRILSAWGSLVESAQKDGQSLNTVLAGNRASTGQVSQYPQEERAAVARHTWLQYQQEDKWIDLDPTLGEAGKSRCTPQTTAEDLPETDYHHLGISVRVEQRDKGTLSSHYLLQTFWRTAELSGSNINYTHAEAAGLDNLIQQRAPPGFHRFTPLLSIDNEYILGEPFLIAGARAGAGGVQSYSNAVGGAFGALGNALPGDSNADANRNPSSAEVTGLWLEFDLRIPEGGVSTMEWPIFDRIDYVARAYGEEDRAPLISLQDPDGPFARLAGSWNVATWLGETSLPDLLAPAGSDAPDIRWAFDSLGTLHQSYYMNRQNLLAAVSREHPGRLLAVRPSLSVMAAQAGAEDADRVSLMIDRIDDKPISAGSPNSVGVLNAVASVAAEAYTTSAPGIVTGEPAVPLPDVPAIFRAAEKNHIGFQLLRPADAAQALELDGSDQARTRLYSDLLNGSTAIVPKKAVDFEGARLLGWWLIDSRTGYLNDEMESAGIRPGRSMARSSDPMPKRKSRRAGSAIRYVS